MSSTWGCAATATQTEVRQMHKTLQTLQQQQARAEQRLEKLSHRLMVLGDMMEASGAAMPEPVMPSPEVPEHLQVVRLQPGARAAPTNVPPMVEEPPVEIRLGPTSVPKLPIAKVPPPPKSEASKASRQFRGALAEYRRGKPKAALRQLEDFVKAYPAHGLAGKARYWMGECSFELGRYEEAAATFGSYLARYPKSTKRAEALLKLGFANERLGRTVAARKAFEGLVAKFPNSALADLAMARLGRAAKEQTP